MTNFANMASQSDPAVPGAILRKRDDFCPNCNDKLTGKDVAEVQEWCCACLNIASTKHTHVCKRDFNARTVKCVHCNDSNKGARAPCIGPREGTEDRRVADELVAKAEILCDIEYVIAQLQDKLKRASQFKKHEYEANIAVEMQKLQPARQSYNAAAQAWKNLRDQSYGKKTEIMAVKYRDEMVEILANNGMINTTTSEGLIKAQLEVCKKTRKPVGQSNSQGQGASQASQKEAEFFQAVDKAEIAIDEVNKALSDLQIPHDGQLRTSRLEDLKKGFQNLEYTHDSIKSNESQTRQMYNGFPQAGTPLSHMPSDVAFHGDLSQNHQPWPGVDPAYAPLDLSSRGIVSRGRQVHSGSHNGLRGMGVAKKTIRMPALPRSALSQRNPSLGSEIKRSASDGGVTQGAFPQGGQTQVGPAQGDWFQGGGPQDAGDQVHGGVPPNGQVQGGFPPGGFPPGGFPPGGFLQGGNI